MWPQLWATVCALWVGATGGIGLPGLHSLCSSAAGRQLSDLLTDSDDSSNQSYDPNTVECVRYK